MVTNDATILKIKHDVLCEVAKLAWEGTLEEKREELPHQMFPGPQAQFRCCIYKEREKMSCGNGFHECGAGY